MTESELQDNLFATDGYQAVVVDNRPVSLTVYAEAVAKGRSASASFPDSLPSVLVFEARTDDDVAYGAASRVQNFVDAACRFFNTGGTAAEMADVLRRLAPLLHTPLTLPDGYRLMETYPNTEGKFEHVFVSPDYADAVLWVENEFVNLVPCETVIERLTENERLASATIYERFLARRATADGGDAEDPADLPELPGGEDPS